MQGSVTGGILGLTTGRGREERGRLHGYVSLEGDAAKQCDAPAMLGRSTLQRAGTARRAHKHKHRHKKKDLNRPTQTETLITPPTYNPTRKNETKKTSMRTIEFADPPPPLPLGATAPGLVSPPRAPAAPSAHTLTGSSRALQEGKTLAQPPDGAERGSNDRSAQRAKPFRTDTWRRAGFRTRASVQ